MTRDEASMGAGDVPEISVVVPTHDRWPLLSTRALPSALAQEDVLHEVIVVDDGSRDETHDGLAGVENTRLRVIRHERPLGVAVARNTGVEAAAGQWVAFLDDDDLWSPLKLRRQLDVVRAESASFVYSDIVVLDERRGTTYELRAPDADEVAEQLLRRYAIPGGPSNIMASKALVTRLGGFDERLSMTADWDFWLRLARAGKGTRCPGVLVATTAHDANMPMRAPWSELVHDLEHFTAKHRSEGLELDEAGFARWLALQRYRGGRRLEPAFRLLQVALRYRRPRYALRAAALLVSRRSRHRGGAHEPAREPTWLADARRSRYAR